MVRKIKEYKQNQLNLMLVSDQEVSSKNPKYFENGFEQSDAFMKNMSEATLINYVRHMQNKLKEGNIDANLVNQKVTSRRIANNIIRMREKFSIYDKDTECPSRKFMILDKDLRFQFKRRSIDFITTKELKSRFADGKLLKIHDKNIIEVVPHDVKIKEPTTRKFKNFELDYQALKLPAYAHANLLRPNHFKHNLSTEL
jgi:isochorismate hydrolase